MKNKTRKERKSKKGFTKVPNVILYDGTLSIGAKGLLAEFIANPPEWKTYQKEIFGRSTDGKAVQKRALDELEKRGFIFMEQNRNDKGHFQYIYYLTSTLVKLKTANLKPTTKTPIAVSPSTVQPIADEPIVENEPISNTDYLSNTEVSNTDLIKKEEEIKISKRKEDILISKEGVAEQEFIPPSLEEVIHFFKLKGYDSAGAFAFFKEFEGRKWFTIKGEKVGNWKGLATHFVKTKGATYFVLPEEEKAGILSLAKQAYQVIYSNAVKKAEKENNPFLQNGSAREIKSWLIQLALEKGICTADELREHLNSNKPNMACFKDFKKSLGLSDMNSVGKKYV